MSSSCELIFPACAAENPNLNPNSSTWRFTWEAQSHTSTLRLILFNPKAKPSSQCTVNLCIEQSLLTVTFSEKGDSIRVPVPRVLIDPESPVHCRVFDDHVEVKLTLLLPVDHPLISDLDLPEPKEKNRSQLIMDLFDCDFPEPKGDQTYNSQVNSAKMNSLSPLPEEERIGVKPNNEVVELVIDGNSSTCIPSKLKEEDKVKSLNEVSSEANCHIRNHNTGCCTNNFSERFSQDIAYEMKTKLLDKQKIFLKGCLGDAFMLRHSNLSKDVKWIEFPCPKCSSLIGSHPCSSDNAPLDDGVRLYKFNISTCLPVRGLNDLFREYTLERIFSRQLLEAAQDELTFRTVVRDIHTKSPLSQIVLLNPNTWCYSGFCMHNMEPVAKINLYPVAKLLFSANINVMELETRNVEEWVTKHQADEVYMLPSQVKELITNLVMANSMLPPSHMLLQGFYMSSLKR
ncbi:unnamed protein product [Withania somnifera]